VRIRKGAASCLEISCSSYPAELVIESLEFGSSDESGSGVDFRLVFDPCFCWHIIVWWFCRVCSRFPDHGFTSFAGTFPRRFRRLCIPTWELGAYRSILPIAYTRTW
jgi:hypothetical protein